MMGFKKYVMILLAAVLMINMALPALAVASTGSDSQLVPICTSMGEKWVAVDDFIKGDVETATENNDQFECALCFVVAACGMAAVIETPAITFDILTITQPTFYQSYDDVLYRASLRIVYHGRAPPVFIL